MTDLFRQDEDAAEVMDNETGTDLVFARDMDPGDRHAENVDEQIKGNQIWRITGILTVYAQDPNR